MSGPMEEYQLVFVLWLAKFAAFCVVALFVLNVIDRRWRAPRAQTPPAASRAPLAMSRSRTPS